MMWRTLIALMAVLAITYAETYTSQYDDIDTNEFIQNPKILHANLNCILDKGKCTPAAKELKSHVKEAVQTGCQKCTEKQKSSARQIMKHIIAHEQKYWEELKAKYDPNNEYQKTYEDFLKQ